MRQDDLFDLLDAYEAEDALLADGADALREITTGLPARPGTRR